MTAGDLGSIIAALGTVIGITGTVLGFFVTSKIRENQVAFRESLRDEFVTRAEADGMKEVRDVSVHDIHRRLDALEKKNDG